MSNPFVFIVGCPRSGTTLLQRMLDAHPQIAIIPEVDWIARRYEQRDGVTPEGLVTPRLIQDLLEHRGLGRFTPLPMGRQELEGLIASGRGILYPDLIGMFFDRYREARGKPLVGNKSVGLTCSIATLHTLWPRVRFVHLIRDGRDVSLSAMDWRKAAKLEASFSTWREDPVTTAALWWEWHVRSAREAGSSLGSELYYEVRYESLVSDPARECTALCGFLGFPFHDAMLRFYEGRSKTDEGLDAKHAWSPPKPGLRDARSQMSPENLERFEAAAGDLLEELGYPRFACQPRPESLERATKVRSLFEGRPLPKRWLKVLSKNS